VGYLLSTGANGIAVLTSVSVMCGEKSLTSVETHTVYQWFEEGSALANVIKLWDASVNIYCHYLGHL
jgi:hypothetical protein